MLSNNQNKQDQKSTLLLALILYSLIIITILIIQLLILPFFNNLNSAPIPSNQYPNHLKPLSNNSSNPFKPGTYKAIWNFYSNIPINQQNSYLINFYKSNNYYSSNYSSNLYTGTYKLNLNKQPKPTLTIKESIYQLPSEPLDDPQTYNNNSNLIHYLTIGTINHYLRPNTYLVTDCKCIQFTNPKLQEPYDHQLDPFSNSTNIDLLLIYLKPEPTRFPLERLLSINTIKQIE